MTAVEYASHFAQLGWYVFPIRPDTKVPYPGFTWKAESSNDLDKIAKWGRDYPGCNWAIDCGKSGLAVVDVDRKSEKDGLETIKALADQGMEFPPTFTVQTPSGGVHYYYRGIIPSTVDKIGPGIDTRGVGGYVLAAGSTINAVPYRVLSGEPAGECQTGGVR